MLHFRINGADQSIQGDLDPTMPLLWLLRDRLGLLGTKYGCGAGFCGACTVHLNGAAVRSCMVPAISVAGMEVRTIEGLHKTDGSLHPLQQAWIRLDVPQCGYCQSGQLMSAAALLKATPSPTDADIDRAMAGNLCRCGTYQRMRSAIHSAAAQLGEPHQQS